MTTANIDGIVIDGADDENTTPVLADLLLNPLGGAPTARPRALIDNVLDQGTVALLAYVRSTSTFHQGSRGPRQRLWIAACSQ